MKLWAIRMLFVWRWRLGYWDWQAFRAAWCWKQREQSRSHPPRSFLIDGMIVTVGVKAEGGGA